MWLLSMSWIVIFIKLTYLLLMVCPALAEDKLVTMLVEEHEANRLTVCTENGTECEGVLWKAQWAIASATCLADIPFYQLAVIKTEERAKCSEYNTESITKSARVRRVQVMFKHPSHDLALLRLEFPYSEVERLGDTRVAATFLQQFEPWVENTIRSNQPDKPYIIRYPRRLGISIFESPVKTFISLVVVPSVLFIVFFLIITCFTKPKIRPVLRQYEKI